MTVYCGVDFHARVQTVSWLDTQDGEIHQTELNHRTDDVRGFYLQFTGEVIVGIEASGYSSWFEDMLEGIGHQVWVGDAGEIRRLARRRQKNDKRDADHILDLMVKREFPCVHRLCRESREVLGQLRYRHRLVKMRTMAANCLKAIAIGAGLSEKTRLATRKGRSKLDAVGLSAVLNEQSKKWLELIDDLTKKIEAVERWLEERAKADQRVERLRTHPGIGLLTGLALVHTLEPVERFASTRKVAAYVGLDPMEDSSAERKRYGGVSKAGSTLVRFLLVEAGQTAAKRDPQLRSFYQRLRDKRKTAKAKVAVARKLAVRGFIMLRDQIDYSEFLRRGVEARSSRRAAAND
jgi:transposase